MLWVLIKTMTLLSLPVYAFARPQRIPANALPTPLEQVIPTCAQSCVSTTIASSFPTLACLKPDELDGFCCQYSSVAFALEQLIFGCIRRNCPLPVPNSSISVQKLCDTTDNTSKSSKTSSITDTSTFSVRSSTKNQRKTSTESDTSRSTSAPEISSSAVLHISKSTFKPLLPTEITKPASSIPTQTPPVTSSIEEEEVEEENTENEENTDDAESLTTGQIVGISMSVIGVLAFSVGAILSIAYFRRRRLQRRLSRDEAYDFQSSSRPSLDLNKMLSEPKLDEVVKKPGPIANLAQARTLPNLAKDQGPSVSSTQPADIGVAISSGTGTDEVVPNPCTHKARRPLPVNRASSTSGTTIFEEDKKLASEKKPSRIKTIQNRGSATSDQSIETPPFLYEDQLSDQQNKPPVPPKPLLSVDIPQPKLRPDPRFVQPYVQRQQKSSDSCSPKLITASRLIAMLDAQTPIDNNTSYNESSNRNSIEYIPQYYTTPRDQLGVSDSSWEYDASAEKRLESNSRSSSFNKRDSRASETSIETTFPDEETPPVNEPKKLSPVVESPISGLKYPKVPRASNQLVARQSASLRDNSDNDSSKSPSRSPLSARSYRGEISNQPSDKSPYKYNSRLQSKLLQEKSSVSVSSDEGWQILGLKDETAMVAPLKLPGQYERATKQDSSAGQITEIAASYEKDTNLKSPLWDPRLYPWRRGDELFLYLK